MSILKHWLVYTSFCAGFHPLFIHKALTFGYVSFEVFAKSEPQRALRLSISLMYLRCLIYLPAKIWANNEDLRIRSTLELVLNISADSLSSKACIHRLD